jgi:protein-disulfide isomerase
MRTVTASALSLVFLFSLVVGVQAQVKKTEGRQDEAILSELRAIRQLLEQLSGSLAPQRRQQPSKNVLLTDIKGESIGASDAPLTIVEFTDLQCPFCRRFAIGTFPEIKKNWIDTGKLRFVTRDFPLASHAQAMDAARAARCAGEQERFWEIRLALVRNADVLNREHMAKAAADVGLNQVAFSECMKSGKYDVAIRRDITLGRELGVSGTPSFVVGRPTADGIRGSLLVGALPYEEFNATLTSLLQPEK